MRAESQRQRGGGGEGGGGGGGALHGKRSMENGGS